ncbi:MAG: PQQ-binding-like beta-propeller repeat protein, partial [Planctomycetes bacterium]|nr:PQQ-binding-like beta-propeller repeat protein [Planctomycetota bacterium]
MGKSRLKVTQQWLRHFDAPVALVSTAAETGDILVVDEDASLYMLDKQGNVRWSQELSFLPVAIALDDQGEAAAVLSGDGTLVLLDGRGQARYRERVAHRPTSLAVAPFGDGVVLADGDGRVYVLSIKAGSGHFLEAGGSYYYVRFVSSGGAILAVGRYGQVMLFDGVDGSLWEKDFRCHTRLPAASASGGLILVPSPHFGIIVLERDGTHRGLFEVPDGPKCVSVTADGKRLFVVNEKNDLIIFRRDGTLLFRQPFGTGVSHIECGQMGDCLAAAETSGAVERFSVKELRGRAPEYIEFPMEAHSGDSAEGPAVLWRSKVFSALGGPRGGQIALTPSARHAALLDIEGHLRIFDQNGKETARPERIHGLQPTLAAGQSQDFVVAVSSESFLAIDLRSYRQRRIALKNDWTTHFDIAPNKVFFAVADFFRGISLYGEDFERREFFETDAEVLRLAVDGNCHTMVALGGDVAAGSKRAAGGPRGGTLAFYTEHGALVRRLPYPSGEITAAASLGSGFAVAAGTGVDTFDCNGVRRWSVEIPGKVVSIQPTRSQLVITTSDGTASITNAHG